MHRVGCLGEELEALKAKYEIVGDVRYIGLFSAIELVRNRKQKSRLWNTEKTLPGIMKSIIGKLKEKRLYDIFARKYDSHLSSAYNNPRAG